MNPCVVAINVWTILRLLINFWERWLMKGICGKLLEVDLTAGKTKDLPVPETLFEKYLGGRGLGARLLYDMLPAGTDRSLRRTCFFL